MSLLVVLISLALEKLIPAINGLRSLVWLEHYQHWVRDKLETHEKWRGIPSLLAIVLLPVIGIAAIQYFLDDLLTLFSFLFSIIVLIYCLGPEDEHRRVKSYLDAIEDENRSDKDSIQTDLSDILQTGGVASNDASDDETNRINRLVESVLIITHDRMLAVLFWFVVLGPMGAVLYRFTLALLQHKEPDEPQNALQDASQTTDDDNVEIQTDNSDNFDDAVKRLHHLLGWIPSHLTALSYAAMGSFVHALPTWKNKRKNDPEAIPDTDEKRRKSTFGGTTETTPTNHDLLIRIGRASLQFDNKSPEDNNAVRETLGMCGRSLVAWVTILAIMTLAGWAS